MEPNGKPKPAAERGTARLLVIPDDIWTVVKEVATELNATKNQVVVNCLAQALLAYRKTYPKPPPPEAAA